MQLHQAAKSQVFSEPKVFWVKKALRMCARICQMYFLTKISTKVGGQDETMRRDENDYGGEGGAAVGE